jgi:hypothetical protein
MLKDDAEVAEFNYALQLFDMKHRKEARSAVAMDTLAQTNLQFYGPTVIDPTSQPRDLIWDVFHNRGEKVEVVPVGVRTNYVGCERSSDRTRIIVSKRDYGKVTKREEFKAILQVGSGGTRTNFAELTVPVELPLQKISVDGPKRVFADRQTYKWNVYHPDQEVVSTTDSPVSVRATSQRGKDVTEISVAGNTLTNARAFNVRVYPKIQGVQSADPAAVFPVVVGKPGVIGEVRGTFQIEDRINAAKHFGQHFAKAFFCIKVTIYNDFDKPVTVDASSIALGVRYVLRIRQGETCESLSPFVPAWYANQNEQVVNYKSNTYVIWYTDRHPMNFTDVLNSFEFDQRHDPKNVFIKLLRAGGVLASAAGVFTTGADYAKVVSFIQGPVTAGLAEYLLQDLIAHLGYLNANALHDSTTVPRFGSVSKYVFFPRGDIPGVWGLEMPVRIMTVQQESLALEGIIQVEEEKVKTEQ